MSHFFRSQMQVQSHAKCYRFFSNVGPYLKWIISKLKQTFKITLQNSASSDSQSLSQRLAYKLVHMLEFA